jgi:hypothetical protein
MRLRDRAVIALAIAAVVVCPGASRAAQTDASQQVRATLQRGVRLLEAKDYAAFVKELLRPSELDRLMAKFKTIESVAAEIARRDETAPLLERLRAAVTLEPTYRRDGTIASFTFDPPIGRERGLSLEKIGERWYLRD